MKPHEVDEMKKYTILRIKSFTGDDTFIRCGTTEQDFLFAILTLDDLDKAEIIDGGYRSYEEAVAAWPEAASSPVSEKPKGKRL